MVAASFWSLLAPAIELAENSGAYGANGEYAFLPVAGGFLFGAIFVFATDKIISYLGINSPNMMIVLTHTNSNETEARLKYDKQGSTGTVRKAKELSTCVDMDSFSDCLTMQHGTESCAEVRLLYLLHFIGNIKLFISSTGYLYDTNPKGSTGRLVAMEAYHSTGDCNHRAQYTRGSGGRCKFRCRRE